jgi:predicted RND superfamily exporter protein
LDLYSTPAVTDDASLLGGFDSTTEPERDNVEELGLLTGLESGAAVAGVRALMQRYEADDFHAVMAGAPVMQQQLVTSLQRDLARFVGAMLLTVAALLFVLFRRASGVLLPMALVALALSSTVGAMAWNGMAIAPPTQVLPTFLLAVGIGTSVHVLKIFYHHFDAGETPEDAIANTLRHSGLPILMTSLTTAGGLMSFVVAGLKPLVELGLAAPFGVVLSLFYAMVFLPALLTTLPIRRRVGPEPRLTGAIERWIVLAGDFSARRPGLVLTGTAILVAFSIPGLMQLRFTHDVMHWLAPSDPIHEATALIDRELKGSMTLEVIADTGREDGLKEPAVLAGLELLRTRTAGMHRGPDLFVGKTISIADVAKEIHQALNENRSEFYVVPGDARLIAQELLLFENTGTDDLEDLVDSQWSLARFTIKVPYVDPLVYDGFIEEVEATFHEVLGGDVEVVTTGFMGMMGQTLTHVINGLAKSYMLALVIITPLMMLLLASWRIGAASMVPNLSPIILTLGVMGWLDVPIDMFTMMIGGIAIGLVVDDTIHFMHGFRRYYAMEGDARVAVRRTLETTGQALLFTSIVLSIGFLVFALSQMQNLFYFGVFTTLAISSAFLLDILVSPALMVLAARSK